MVQATLTAGEAVRTFRTRAGLSQQDLAEVAGCSVQMISAIERDERTPSPKVADKICSRLPEVSLMALLGIQSRDDEGRPNAA